MKVELTRVTQDALELLLSTKNTRLSSEKAPENMTEEEKADHLEYMRDTIKSSWEFVDYVFRISGVTRAFTHQIVRTRTGSYAQQAMRVVDARQQPVEMPPTIALNPAWAEMWARAEHVVLEEYGQLVDAGAPLQDARGILPTHITTAIMAKFNLRTLHEMAKLRLCTRTQGEYQEVFRAMRAEVLRATPWAEGFLEVHCVATGTCAFPRYGKKECPVYFDALDNSSVRVTAAARFWGVRHEAAPVAKDGKAM